VVQEEHQEAAADLVLEVEEVPVEELVVEVVDSHVVHLEGEVASVVVADDCSQLLLSFCTSRGVSDPFGIIAARAVSKISIKKSSSTSCGLSNVCTNNKGWVAKYHCHGAAITSYDASKAFIKHCLLNLRVCFLDLDKIQLIQIYHPQIPYHRAIFLFYFSLFTF